MIIDQNWFFEFKRAFSSPTKVESKESKNKPWTGFNGGGGKKESKTSQTGGLLKKKTQKKENQVKLSFQL